MRLEFDLAPPCSRNNTFTPALKTKSDFSRDINGFLNPKIKSTAICSLRRTSVVFAIGLAILLQACFPKQPSRKEIAGTWVSAEGALFVFNEDGTFTEKSFPAEFVLLPKNEFKNVKFDGSGKWLLRKGGSNWEVYIDFSQVSDKKCSSAFPLLIAGEKGALDNKPPWYLFVWQDEEGGDRYRYQKENISH